MTELSPWRAVAEELDRWAVEGRQARLWLRDDDAVAATPALTRLLGLYRENALTVLLAVIPLKAEPSLFAVLDDTRSVEVAVHGARHVNHAPPNRKSEEMVPERGRDAIVAELTQARATLTRRLGERAGDWYVPPWNRLQPQVAAWLPDLGFRALSTFGSQRLTDGTRLAEVNTHVDLIDWRNGRIGRPPAWIAKVLAEELLRSRTGAGHAIGILTHHLDHDPTVWETLTAILATTGGHPGARWTTPHELAMQGGGS